jgi:hypothetical protein
MVKPLANRVDSAKIDDDELANEIMLELTRKSKTKQPAVNIR